MRRKDKEKLIVFGLIGKTVHKPHNHLLRHKVIPCAHEHANPPDWRDDQETHGKPEPKRFAASPRDEATYDRLQNVKKYHKNDNPCFFVHITIQLALFMLFLTMTCDNDH